jgi:energy-coupling factor transport system ATP-binding protein
MKKESHDIVKGLSLKVGKGEFFALLGGNGTGKTTTLSLISGINKPYRGKIRLFGRKPSEIPNLFDGLIGVLPQNPQALFVKSTVMEDLLEILPKGMDKAERERRAYSAAKLCAVEELLDRHPYDLSGGEQQRAALAKVLLLRPKLLLLDEPTKGLDAEFKRVLAAIIKKLTAGGVAVVMVSHDIEFCALYAHAARCYSTGSIVRRARRYHSFLQQLLYYGGQPDGAAPFAQRCHGGRTWSRPSAQSENDEIDIEFEGEQRNTSSAEWARMKKRRLPLEKGSRWFFGALVLGCFVWSLGWATTSRCLN